MTMEMSASSNRNSSSSNNSPGAVVDPLVNTVQDAAHSTGDTDTSSNQQQVLEGGGEAAVAEQQQQQGDQQQQQQQQSHSETDATSTPNSVVETAEQAQQQEEEEPAPHNPLPQQQLQEVEALVVVVEEEEDDDLGDFGEIMGSCSTGHTNTPLFFNPPAQQETALPVPFQPTLPLQPALQSAEAEMLVGFPPTASEDDDDDAKNTAAEDDKDLDWLKKDTATSTAVPKQGYNTAGNSLVNTVRKAGVAVAGGTLTAVGLVMIPLPTPMGCVVAGSGMALLGTEFEAANRVMQSVQDSAEAARDKLLENVESTIEDDDTTDDKQKAQPDITITTTTKSESSNVDECPNNLDDGKGKDNGACSQDNKDALAVDNNRNKVQEKVSEICISVNADSYFETDDAATTRLKQQQQSSKKSVASSWRQKWSMETRGFLATSVLPLLQKTKQFGSGSNGGGGNAGV